MRLSRMNCLASAVAVLSSIAVASAQPKMQFRLPLAHAPADLLPRRIDHRRPKPADRYSFNVIDVHNQRFGPYTDLAAQRRQSAPASRHLGAQVSFSGSLIENLNALEAAGVNGGMWNNWKRGYKQASPLQHVARQSAPRPRRLRLPPPAHAAARSRTTSACRSSCTSSIYAADLGHRPCPYSKGIFPPETAFSERIIPALVAEGLDWVLVDNIHFDRADADYPHTNASEPLRAEQGRPDQPRPGRQRRRVGPAQQRLGPEQVCAPFSLPAAQRPVRRSRTRARSSQIDRRPGRPLRRQRRRPRRLRCAAVRRRDGPVSAATTPTRRIRCSSCCTTTATTTAAAPTPTTTAISRAW